MLRVPCDEVEPKRESCGAAVAEKVGDGFLLVRGESNSFLDMCVEQLDLRE